jgi:hypothetical protein
MKEKTAEQLKQEALEAACNGILNIVGKPYGLKFAKHSTETNPNYKGGVVYYNG